MICLRCRKAILVSEGVVDPPRLGLVAYRCPYCGDRCLLARAPHGDLRRPFPVTYGDSDCS